MWQLLDTAGRPVRTWCPPVHVSTLPFPPPRQPPHHIPCIPAIASVHSAFKAPSLTTIVQPPPRPQPSQPRTAYFNAVGPLHFHTTPAMLTRGFLASRRECLCLHRSRHPIGITRSVTRLSGRQVDLTGLNGAVLGVDISIWLHQIVRGMRSKTGEMTHGAHVRE